jgi:hypothetical protein
MNERGSFAIYLPGKKETVMVFGGRFPSPTDERDEDSTPCTFPCLNQTQ